MASADSNFDATLREMVAELKENTKTAKQYGNADKEGKVALLEGLQDAVESSGAKSLAEFKSFREIEEKAAKERKKLAGEQTREAFLLRQELIGKGITDEDFLSKAESDRKEGLEISVDQYKLEHADWLAANKRDKRDLADKRKKDKKEEARIATNQRSEETLGKILGTLGLSQKMAERAAKKAMQMKESVHKWWEDKKEKMASAAKGILEWIMKAAGLVLLWALFKYLSTLDFEKLYKDAQDFWEGFKSFWSGIVSIGAWVGALKFGGWVKGLFGPKGSLFNFGQKMKGLWDSFKKLKFIKMITDITTSFKSNMVKTITGIFTKLQKSKFIGPLFEGIGKLFKAGGKIFKLFGGGAKLVTVGPWKIIVDTIKSVFKTVTAPFQKGGSVGGVIDDILKFVTKIPGLGTVTKFVGTAAKLFAKLFAPISLVWGIVESIFAGWDEAEKEKGGLGQKILAFMSGALKKLLDFFVFDLANMVQDGIKWAIKWVMSLFGFSEEEQKAATDWDIVSAVRDAVFGAIDWVKGLFKFDGKGISFKGLAPLIDIILFPLNAAFKWLSSLFGWDTDKDGKKKKDWSLGGLITGALDSIFAWFTKLFDIDFASMAKDLMPDFMSGWFEDSKEDVEKQLAAAKKGVNIKGIQRVDEAKVAELEAKLAKMATGGTILPGGAAIVGEGSMQGELVLNANSAAKVIPASKTAELMSGIGGGQSFAPTTIVNSAPASTTMIASSSSTNPISQKYFRSD